MQEARDGCSRPEFGMSRHTPVPCGGLAYISTLRWACVYGAQMAWLAQSSILSGSTPLTERPQAQRDCAPGACNPKGLQRSKLPLSKASALQADA
eukprot:1161850-Pelagomonas_calceolata.AAC.10